MPKAPEPKEIREMFSDFLSDWREIREDGDKNMKYVAGDPWAEKDKKQREDASRPCLSTDEIGQYLNQAINNLRQNKRGVEVTPKSEDANQEDAEHRASIIRGIEYQSNAQAAYVCAAENAMQRNCGYAILRVEEDGDGFDQVIRVQRVPNPNAVLFNPDYKRADASDVAEAFYTDVISETKFKARFGKRAKPANFDSSLMLEAKDWIKGKNVQIAEFWKIFQTPTKLFLIDGGEAGPVQITEDEYKENPQGLTVLKTRKKMTPSVMQYITNGLAILEENEWAGTRIPICGCFGKEIFLDDGGRVKRMLLSMVSLARDPQMLHAYYTSLEAEEAGQSPKAPVMGYKGQFESDKDAWETLNKIPRAYIQVDPLVDGATGQVLPLPTRPQFTPNFAGIEIAKESARRSIQSAMGISPLPTSAQRRNEKSGIALQQMEQSESVGSFHFVDNYKGFLHNAGWQMNELIEPIYDTGRTVPVVQRDDTHASLRINDEQYQVREAGLGEEGKPHLFTDRGDYGVTISDSPSSQSQRDAADAFVDTVVANIKNLPVQPQQAAKIISIGIKMKNLGPLGDEMADIISPPEGDSGQQLAQMQQQMQQGQQAMQEMQTELQKLQMEKQGKVIDNEYKLQIEEMKKEQNQLNNNIKVLIAEIQTKNQDKQQEQELYKTFWVENHNAAHEIALQKDQQGHDAVQADKAAQQQQQAQATDQAHQQTMAQQQQPQQEPQPAQ